MEKLLHSVYLDEEKCLGCTTCLRSCPTGAIRVRGGKAIINESKCIDCGECIRICPHHAKLAKTDPLSLINDFKYKVAIPAPAIIGQFKTKYSFENILSAIKALGFDEVVEVAYGAEVVGQALKYEYHAKRYPKPLISSACPAVVKLIQVRFPELTDNICRLKSPMAMTARLVRKRLRDEGNYKNSEIGVFFITPCAAKATMVNNPASSEYDKYDQIDGAIAIKDIYPDIVKNLNDCNIQEGIHNTTPEAFSWALSGGECEYLKNKNVLHVDGIQNVINVLDEIECGKLDTIEFFEGLACIGGCVGGCLTVENNYVAKMYIQDRAKKMKQTSTIHMPDEYVKSIYNSGMMHIKERILPRSPEPLDQDINKAIEKMKQIEILEEKLPGLDCGSCGSPGCRALAEDIVAGKAKEIDCVFVLKDRVRDLSVLTNELLQVEHPTEKPVNKKPEFSE
ncbi:[Fe-Fe] hydrogenase large subunit C-terminal domain-containing protein [Acetobacterium woodii]|uniref:Hydrogenase large subunit-like protein n=1 Tax=Acetobacterium woodii (strain ATCC 29683 / DSM 1030 / JCM 2381 / KCTC 1655 / WB1) TaxID=931626 RepID=H6LFH0_ACEWD|nr:[Fe-Fe] hydrogenase large subunit C-terminal domain-containing protein [Acetobacterium woodii]AFA49457.1 hydrogenase large subunit-like protein [Acetobacterium woodii DSM 1030]